MDSTSEGNMNDNDTSRGLIDREYLYEAQLQKIQEELDRRFFTTRRELGSVKELLDRVLAEREKAVALTERERERAAAALRTGLEQAITEGDGRLREHVSNQYEQVSAALISADKLELARIDAITKALEAHVARQVEQINLAREAAMQRADAMAEALSAQIAEVDRRAIASLDAARREANFAQEANDRAIQKAEVASDKRFDAVNEFREQLREQTASFMPREVVDQLVTQINQRITTLESMALQGEGAKGAIQRKDDRSLQWAIWAAGALVIIVVVIINLILKLH